MADFLNKSGKIVTFTQAQEVMDFLAGVDNVDMGLKKGIAAKANLSVDNEKALLLTGNKDIATTVLTRLFGAGGTRENGDVVADTGDEALFVDFYGSVFKKGDAKELDAKRLNAMEYEKFGFKYLDGDGNVLPEFKVIQLLEGGQEGDEKVAGVVVTVLDGDKKPQPVLDLTNPEYAAALKQWVDGTPQTPTPEDPEHTETNLPDPGVTKLVPKMINAKWQAALDAWVALSKPAVEGIYNDPDDTNSGWAQEPVAEVVNNEANFVAPKQKNEAGEDTVDDEPKFVPYVEAEGNAAIYQKETLDFTVDNRLSLVHLAGLMCVKSTSGETKAELLKQVETMILQNPKSPKEYVEPYLKCGDADLEALSLVHPNTSTPSIYEYVMTDDSCTQEYKLKMIEKVEQPANFKETAVVMKHFLTLPSSVDGTPVPANKELKKETFKQLVDCGATTLNAELGEYTLDEATVDALIAEFVV